MSLLDRSLASQAFKLSQRRTHTATNRDFYNESEESSYVVFAKDIWASPVDPTPSVSVSSGDVVRVKLRLKNVFTAGKVNPNSYLAKFYWDDQEPSVQTALTGKINPRTGEFFSTTLGDIVGENGGQRVGHIVPDILNTFRVTEGGYRAVINTYDLSRPIAPGDASDWFLDTFAGVVVHEIDSNSNFMLLNGGNSGDASYTGFDEQAFMDCYIYVGNFLTDVIGISGSGGSIPTSVTDAIALLQSQMGDAQADIIAISGQLGANFQGAIDQLTTRIDAISGNFNTLDSTVTSLNNTVSNVSTKVDTISGNFNTLDSTVTSLNNTVSGLTTDINTISGNIDTNTSDIQALQTQTSILDTQINDISGNFAKLSKDNIFTGSVNTFQDVIIQGTLTTAGSAYSVNSQTISVTGNFFTLNDGEVGAGVTNGEAGILIDRGLNTDYRIVFNEADDLLRVGISGQENIVATRSTSPVIQGALVLGDANGLNYKQDSSIAWDNSNLNVIGGITVTESISGANAVLPRSEIESMISAFDVGDVTSSQLAQLSGALKTRIEGLETNSVTISQLQTLSGGIDSRLDALEAGGSGDVTTAQLRAISGSLDSRLYALEAGGSGDVTTAQLRAISGSLDSRLDGFENQLSSIISASGNVIGAAEDGTYTDGLFTEFTETTPIGHAIDKINEILKAIAPSPPPVFSEISFNSTGVVGRLSFGTSNDIVGYTNDNKDVNVEFSATGTERGIFAKTGTVTGILNDQVLVGANGAYDANSFLDGNLGQLEIWVNDDVSALHIVDLTTFASGSSVNGNGSGFNLSVVKELQFSGAGGNLSLDAFKYRTGSWTVGASDFRNGQNEVKVIHRIGATVRNSASVKLFEFIVDDNTDPVVYTNEALGAYAWGTLKQLSGVKYYESGTVEYSVDIDNAYKNTFANSTRKITIAGANATQTDVALAGIGALEDETKQVNIVDKLISIAVAGNDRLLGDNVTVSTTVPRTVQTENSSSGVTSIEKFMMDNVDPSSTNIVENFVDELYRMETGFSLSSVSYSSGPSNSPATWDSTVSLVSAYSDGLLVYNGRLAYPNKTGYDGSQVSNGNFGAITHPTTNVNYSGATQDRSYIRYFYIGDNIQNFGIKVNATSTTFVPITTGLTANNMHMEILAPNTTKNSGGTSEFKDAYQNYFGEDSIGIYQAALDAGLPSGYRGYTLGQKSTNTSGKVIVVKLTASQNWNGQINSINVQAIT